MPPPSAATTGVFDDLLAKAVVHHAASASGLAGAAAHRRAVAGHRDRKLGAGPGNAVDIAVLQWLASQMRGKRRSNRTLMRMVATVVGAAALPLAQLPTVFDIGM